MTGEQMALLDRLFEAASALPEADRPAWLAEHCSDPEVRAELESLLPHAGPAGGFTSALDSAADLARKTPIDAGHLIGPYRVVGVLGAGGMGTVYEAVRDDDQFRQRVAIKVLRISARSEAALRRFLLERQILAELEHPNIARLFDGGTAADGSPYIVMERIDGQPLIEYADARQLTLRQRLELFRQVANAVQYAHQKLIVHRDLKPGNILVGSDGVPKLLDFGIAKLLDPDTAGAEALTATGFQLMTPDYASPEQVQGKPVTVASDVYSLGAVLYELISGTRPHRLKTYHPAEITDQICMQETPPPSSTGHPALRGDLDTIVLKAMQKSPERRYNSAEQFSEDIRRYLEGLPVLARPDTAGYRLRKFVRRHWVGVSAAAAVVLALSAGIAVSMYQARLARDRFNLVRTLANKFLFDFHSELVNLPGSTKAQAMVVSTALEYLEKLSRTAGSDRAVLEDVAIAYGKVADAQGAGNTSRGGDSQAALQSLRKSVELYRRLAKLDPSKRHPLAKMLLEQANIEERLQDNKAGLEHVREAAEILEALLPTKRADVAVVADCGAAHGYWSRLLRNEGQIEEALKILSRAQQYFREAIQIRDLPTYKYRLAVSVNAEGDLRLLKGDVQGGIQTLQGLQDLCQELIRLQPKSRNYKRFRIISMGVLAQAYHSLFILSARDAKRASDLHEQILAADKELLASDARDASALQDLAVAESEASLPMREIDPARAVALGESSIARFDELLRATPSDSWTIYNRARGLLRYTLALLAHRRTDAAIARAAEAVKAFQELIGSDVAAAREKPYRNSAVIAFSAAAQAYAAGKQDSEARRWFDRALELLDPEGQAAAPLQVAVTAAYAFDQYADYWIARGDRAQARAWLERSRQVWATRPQKTPAVEERREQAEARLREVQP